MSAHVQAVLARAARRRRALWPRTPAADQWTAVLDLREVFARPWEGEGTLELPPWLRWFPGPRRFGLRTEITDLQGDRWTVVDTTTMPSGARQERRMAAEQVAPDRVRVTADDMPGGAEITVSDSGFSFSPYVLRTAVLGPVRLPLRFTDDVELAPLGDVLVDRIEIRFLRVRVARVVLRLRRFAAP